MRSYQELIRYSQFEDRFRYLKLHGIVGKETFGFDRWLNQQFYNTHAWKMLRRQVIIRDNACDLGCVGYDLETGVHNIFIHHMNPISVDDIANKNLDLILNPDFLITTSFDTHQAIHYGDESLLPVGLVERQPYDTCPWRA